MRQAPIRVLLAMCFLLLMGLAAEGQVYQRPTPGNGGQPTAADLETYDGASRSLTVQLLNLTPYDIQFVDDPGVTWSITSTDEAEMQDRNPAIKKSFMFVPVGAPSLIPGAPAQDFVSPYLADGITPNPAYDPNYIDTTTHPYLMVFSWDDRGGFVANNWVNWTVKGVKFTWCDESGPTPVCEYRYQDVGLGLWMYRNQPTFKLSSSFLPVLSKSLLVTFHTLSLPVELENPLAWADEFLAIGELAKGATEFAKENTQDNDGEKMWVASYVIPNPKSICVLSGSNCTPSTMTPADTGDAVYSLWPAAYAGPSPDQTHGPQYAAEAQLVVSVHLLRGQRAKQCDPALYPNVCPLGSEPLVMITVMRATDFAVGAMVGAAPDSSITSTENHAPTDPVRLFLLQAGAGSIRELLMKRGRPGLLALRGVIEALDPAQQQVLMQMVRTMGSGRLPTQQERQLVHLITVELKARLR